MNDDSFECVVFEPGTLIPSRWQTLAAAGPVRTFNAALLRDGAGWILAYRVVLVDGLRRIAFARLRPDLQLEPGSPVPFSDHVRFPDTSGCPPIARQWLADPRLYRFGNRCFVYWNSGWHEPMNHQFLQEFDPTTLLPVGAPREMILCGERKPLEKNWSLFQAADGGHYAVYSIAPHRVLQCALEGSGDILFKETATLAWSPSTYPACHGGLRGGAPPVFHDGRFWSFCHSVHDGPQGYCYAAAVYAFADAPGFAPVLEPLAPLPLAASLSRVRQHPRLNQAVDKVIYPCGAGFDGTRWLISHGINDETCALSFVPHTAVETSVRPLGA